MLGLGRILLQYIVRIVHARIEIVVEMVAVFHQVLETGRSARTVVITHFVLIIEICIRADIVTQTSRHRQTEATRIGNGRLAAQTFLRRDDQYAVGTLHTVHSGRGSVFQNRHGLDIVRVDRFPARHISFHQVGIRAFLNTSARRTFDTVDDNQRVRIVQRSLSSDSDRRSLRTRLTRVLHRGQTGQTSGQSRSDVADGRLHDVLGCRRRKRSNHGRLFLRTVSDHDRLVERLLFGLQLNPQILDWTFDSLVLRNITEKTDRQLGRELIDVDREKSPRARHNTLRCAFQENGRADNPIPGFIDHRSRYHILPHTVKGAKAK